MDVIELRNQIKNKTLDNIYIFTGLEVGVMDIYIQQISKVSGCATSRVDCVMDITKDLNNKSFLSLDSCYIVRDDKEYLKNEKLQDFVATHIGNNILILLYTSLDKRTKFYTEHKDMIVTFDYLSVDILTTYIQKKISLSDKNCAVLCGVCENDYSRILLEIDKINTYAIALNIGADDAFIELLEQNVIYQPPKDAIFDFTKSVCTGKYDCFELLMQSYAYGENTLALISVLYNNIKQMLQVQSCKSTNNAEVAEITGLTPWQVKCARDNIGAYSVKELVNALKVIRKAEMGIKMGEIEDKMAVEYILVNIL